MLGEWSQDRDELKCFSQRTSLTIIALCQALCPDSARTPERVKESAKYTDVHVLPDSSCRHPKTSKQVKAYREPCERAVCEGQG